VNKIPLLVIAGPTASGKSALAFKCAKKLCGELISGDSMQIYKGMDIGTAKPTKAEQAEVKHHLVDVIEISEAYSSGDFKDAAKSAAREIFSRGKLPILVGGSGLYVELVVNDFSLPEISSSDKLRDELYGIAREKGNEYLHSMLGEIDPESAEAIHFNNVKRVVRAIEVYRGTGVTMSEWNRRSKMNENEFEPYCVYLDWEREKLYSRINERVDEFVKNGLLDEARTLYENGLESTPTASKAIGYKELLPYLKGVCELDECIDALKQSTRNLAKRQVTYFTRMRFDKKLDPDKRSSDELFEELLADEGFSEFIRNFNNESKA